MKLTPQQNRRNCSQYQRTSKQVRLCMSVSVCVCVWVTKCGLDAHNYKRSYVYYYTFCWRNCAIGPHRAHWAPSRSAVRHVLSLCAGQLKLTVGQPVMGGIKTKFVVPWFSAIKWYRHETSSHRFDTIWFDSSRLDPMKKTLIVMSSSSGAANQKFRRVDCMFELC